MREYEEECNRVRQDLSIAENRLRDFQARNGAVFMHDHYLAELTAVRDELKACLSGTAPEPSTEPLPSASELAEKIKALKAAQTIDAAPERIGRRRNAAEEPVTARIRRRLLETVQAATHPHAR